MTSPPDSDSRTPESLSATRSGLPIWRALSFLIAAGLLLLLIRWAGLQRLADILKRTSLAGLAGAAAIYAVTWLGRTWRLRHFVRHAGRTVPALELFKVHIAGYALNSLLPAKLGDVAMIVYLRMRGLTLARAAAIAVQLRILDLLACVLLCVPGLWLLFRQDAPDTIRTSLLLCVLLLAIPLCGVALDRTNALGRLLTRLQGRWAPPALGRVLAKAGEAYADYREIVTSSRLFAASVGVSLAIWLGDTVTGWAVAAAVGTPLGFGWMLFAVSIGNIGKVIPITPGAVGVYESVLAGMLVLGGAPADVAVVVALLDHLLKKLFNLAVGLPAAADLGLQVGHLRQQRATLQTSPD